MPIRITRSLFVLVDLLCVAWTTSPATAQLYRQTFEVDSTTSWIVNKAPPNADVSTNFFFNYSTVGIPAAPSGAGRRGMKLQVNLFSGIFSGMSVSPISQAFTGDYIVRFDWWHNVNGPFPVGGSGSTNLSTFGIGTSGTSAQWPGGRGGNTSVFFGATGDGNSSNDYRAYSSAAQNGYPSGSPIYTAQGADNNNNTNPYYSIFGGVPAPAAQISLFPQQTGSIHVGAAGMAWHHVRIRKSGNVATWTLDGRRIAIIDLNTVTLGGSNLLFGHSDVNGTSTTDPNGPQLLFTLIDNILVTRPADINGDGTVGIADLLMVISNWGLCPAPPNLDGCSTDLAPTPTGDGTVNIADLLFVISNWG